jgi:hypothetical protein
MVVRGKTLPITKVIALHVLIVWLSSTPQTVLVLSRGRKPGESRGQGIPGRNPGDRRDVPNFSRPSRLPHLEQSRCVSRTGHSRPDSKRGAIPMVPGERPPRRGADDPHDHRPLQHDHRPLQRARRRISPVDTLLAGAIAICASSRWEELNEQLNNVGTTVEERPFRAA